MASLRDRIAAFLNPTQALRSGEGDTRVSTPGGAEASLATYERLKADQDRTAIVKTCRLMYDTDPRVRKSLRIYARDLVRSGFFVKSENTRAAELANALNERLGLAQRLQDCVRLTGKDGDSFYEVVIDEALLVTDLSRKPTLRMHRNSNMADELDEPRRAFWMGGAHDYSPEPPADAIWFPTWQMIHARWDHDPERRYGTPMWASATGAFKKAAEGETDVAVRRKTRAGMRYLHVVEGAAADVEAYKAQNKAALDTPFAAQLDFFTNKPGSISSIQGDAKLGEIADIVHHIETMFTASDVPMELIAYGGALNRDVLGEKKEEYEETLEDGREWLEAQVVKPLIERQWLLQGILPAGVKYQIVWRTAKGITPVMLRDLADAMMRLKLLGVKEEVTTMLLAKFLPDVDLEILRGEGVEMDTARFADILKGISV